MSGDLIWPPPAQYPPHAHLLNPGYGFSAPQMTIPRQPARPTRSGSPGPNREQPSGGMRAGRVGASHQGDVSSGGSGHEHPELTISLARVFT